MATSGSITGSAKNDGSVISNYTFWAEWKRNSYSTANNTSNITVTLKIKRTDHASGAYNLDKKPSVSLSVNGSAKTPTISCIDTRNYVTCTFATWTGNVTHEDDGTLSCPITASFTHYGSSSLDAGTLSGKADLTSIPRASTISSAGAVTLGNKCSVKWTPMATSFRYKLKFVLGSWSYTTGAIHPNTTSAYTYVGYTIPHDVAKQLPNKSQGTMTVYLYTYSNSGATTQVGSASSKTFTVTIPDTSISSAGAVTLGNKCSVKWTPKAAFYRYKLKFSIGSWSYTTGAIHPNTTSAYTYTGYTIPLDVAKQITSASQGTMTVTLYTYSDSGATAQAGGSTSKTFTVTIPDNSSTKPTVSMSLSPVSSLDSAFDSLYIQGKTKVKATLSAEGKYSADISSYSMKVNGTSYGSSASYTSGYLSTSGSIRAYGYAKDSRGFTGSTYKDISVIAYSKPKITVSVCERCDSSGNLSDTGTYLKIKATRSYSTVKSGGVQKNFCKIRYRYKAASASSYSSWTTILASSDLSSNTVETSALLGGVLAVNTSYFVQVQAIDDIGEYATATINIPTEEVYCHRTKNALGLGKYAEGENLLDVGWDARFHGEVYIGDSSMTLKEYILAVISEGG